ncbi:precorrin-6A synthase (deacetylating) [Terrabacter sp. C0L_2]|uniref:precorrin-6A synthase (deacetylating) n=1 Tax=Terrabacter sp. C0L_2 TaxID=3108389 RepID=UPI002ED3F8B4|nr:precorrin-6A synthase (deacetylating) [Terrabacter sp. C0L_2]
MIDRIRIIGIGMGDPLQVTGEAARALGTVDVFLVADKGDAKSDLVAARQAVCEALIPADHAYRVVEVPDPRRGPDAERDDTAYGRGVRDWHAARVDAYADVIESLGDGETTVGFLVWGDPAFYDSTIRVVDALVQRWAAEGLDVDHDVIAGISAPQLLAARHRIPLNRIGAPIHITTGRRLVDEYDPALGDVVVMLDGQLACAELADAFPDVELYWGAYLGTPDELLVQGRLADVVDEVRRLRAEARERHGWVMDTYLLRPPVGAAESSGPSGFPDTEPLGDGVVTVRPVTAADWEVVRDEHNNEESLRWDFVGRPHTDERARRLAAQARREWRLGRAARFVIVDAATGQGAGVINVMRMGPPGLGLIGYGVLPAFRGRGFTTRALRLVSRWAFDEAGIDRLELGHKADNVASGRAAAKAGFTPEGRLRQRLPNPDGTRSDEIYYAFVRGDAQDRTPPTG